MQNIKPKISWEAPEFKAYEKGGLWYALIILAALAILAFFIFVQKDFFAAATIVVAAIVVLYFATHKPNMVTYELTGKGITVGRFHFPYSQLKYFWIVESEHNETVNFVTNTLISREIIMELGGQDPETIREYLSQYLPEHPEPRPTLSQRMTHFLKF